MSGHSKWATIKHQKGAKDKARGKLFAKVLRQVEVAAREGGGDPESNPTLRTMFQKARDASVPMDTIDRAIKRGTGELEGVTYESITYEGYAPGGVAVLVETLTDNRNRTGAEVRALFSKHGGSMAEPGAVAWQFERKGSLLVERAADEETLMLAVLDAGAEDLADDGEAWRVTTPPADLHAVRAAVEAEGFAVSASDLTLVAQNNVPLDGVEAAKKVLRLIDALDDHDDVQNVYANFDIADDVLAAVEA
jgi:YebC/PmpR family DNA-binding regulatory protein